MKSHAAVALEIPATWYSENAGLREVVPPGVVLKAQEWWIHQPGNANGQHRYLLELAHEGPEIFAIVESVTRRLGAKPSIDRRTGMLRAYGDGWFVFAKGHHPDQNFGLIVQFDRPIGEQELWRFVQQVAPLASLLELAHELNLRVAAAAHARLHDQRDRGWIELARGRKEHVSRLEQWLVTRGFQRGDHERWGKELRGEDGSLELVIVGFDRGMPVRGDLNPEGGWSGTPCRFTPLPLPWSYGSSNR